MFDLSWTEIVFVFVLAIVIIGPRDLPKAFHAVARLMNKAKKVVNNAKGSITQLQRELDIESGKKDADNHWHSLLPKELQHLPDDFIPGSLTKEQHEQRNTLISQAKQEFTKNQSNAKQSAKVEKLNASHTNSN